jgi:hypothetical protein
MGKAPARAISLEFLLALIFALPLIQGWVNFFVGGPNEKSKMSGGPT